MIAIIDYDAGNLKSVQKALASLGEESQATRDAGEILAADKIILPGVGAFGEAMGQLKKYGLDKVIHEAVAEGIPFLMGNGFTGNFVMQTWFGEDHLGEAKKNLRYIKKLSGDL